MDQIELTPEQEQKLLTYLKDEIGQALSDRSLKEQDWAKWEKAYEAKPDEQRKSFPWDGAANIVVPLIGEKVDSIVSRMMVLWKVVPFWTAKSFDKTMDSVVGGFEKLLNWANVNELRLSRVVRPTIGCTVKMGDGFARFEWKEDTRLVKQYDEQDNVVEKPHTFYDGPCYIHRPLDAIIFPWNAKCIQTSPWLADTERYRWGDLKRMELQGILFDVDRLKGKESAQPAGTTAEAQATNSRMQMSPRKTITCYRVWLDYDIDDDEQDEKIVVWVDEDFKFLLSKTYHPYWHQKRPYLHFKLFPRDNHAYSMGVCEYLMDMQEEITTVHRQRIDNATLANIRWALVRSGSPMAKPGFKLHPGKLSVTDDPAGDFVPQQFGEVYPSSVNEEMIIQSLSEKRIGLSEQALGKAPRKETATTTLALIQEGNRRLDDTMEMSKETLSEMAVMYIQLHQQFKPKGKAIRYLGPDGQIVEQAIQIPRERIEGKVFFEVTAASEAASKEIQRQQLITLFGLFAQFYQQMFQLVEVIGQAPPGPIQMYAIEVANAARTFMVQILEGFDVKNSFRLVPDLVALLTGGANGQGSGATGGAGTGEESSMAMADQGVAEQSGPFGAATSVASQGPGGAGQVQRGAGGY